MLYGSATADSSTPTGCIQWPAPVLAGFPCGGLITQVVIDAWNPMAIDMVFTDTAKAFPGVQCTAEFSLCRRCPCPSGCCRACGVDRVDLSRHIRYPIQELVSLTVDGAPSPDLAQYRIQSRRYLTRSPDVWWPWHNRQRVPGAAGTASWVVRFGREVPPTVSRARDSLLYLLIMSNAPPSGAQHGDDEVTIVENGRTITFGSRDMSKLREWVTETYGYSNAMAGFGLDPAEGDPVIDIEVYG